MPRLAKPRGSRQHAKGKKRPRAWHRSRSTGRHAAKALAVLASAEQERPA
jgi:hypothetical protein